MGKKNQTEEPKIIENEPVVIDVEASEVKFKLKVNVGFCDKYTGVNYKIGDIIEVEKNRYDELLKDDRKLVSKV